MTNLPHRIIHLFNFATLFSRDSQTTEEEGSTQTTEEESSQTTEEESSQTTEEEESSPSSESDIARAATNVPTSAPIRKLGNTLASNIGVAAQNSVTVSPKPGVSKKRGKKLSSALKSNWKLRSRKNDL